MINKQTLSRLEFLKLADIVISVAALKACIPESSARTLPPATTSSKAPTHMPAPTSTSEPPEPLFPEMVLVEPGSFQMGSTQGYSDQQSVRRVNITKPYCNWLSEKAGLTPCYNGKGKLTICDLSANGYRLPTEAEWEYAARGGQKSQGFIYASGNDPGEVAWFADNSSDQVHIVGQKLPNELGVYDMSGNIYEWCWDWYSKDYYAACPVNDPQGPHPSQTIKPYEFLRSRRSGSWREEEADIWTTKSSFDAMDYPGDNGFRLVRNAM